jgi:hypothetical protein
VLGPCGLTWSWVVSVAVVLKFKPGEGEGEGGEGGEKGACPELRRDDRGQVISPLFPGEWGKHKALPPRAGDR